jgi:hypothetical protein
MATVINFVRNQMFVEFTFWNFWAVPIKALNVTSFATVTDPTYVTLVVPRFPEKPWTFIAVNASWWRWSSWSGWGSGSSSNAFVSRATWTWSEFLDVTVVAINFVDVYFWTASFVTVTLVSWAVALIFFS